MSTGITGISVFINPTIQNNNTYANGKRKAAYNNNRNFL